MTTGITGMKALLGKLVSISLLGVSVVLLCFSLLQFVPPSNFWIDNLTQLRSVYVLLLILIALIAVALHFRKTTIVAAIALAINMAAIAPLYVWSRATGSKDISILTTNIWGAHNQEYERTIDLIRTYNPDIVCINEITPSWLRELNIELPDYQYHFDEGLSGGAAIYSKIPIERQIPLEGPKVRRYGVRGVVHVKNQPVLVIAEHPPAPYLISKWERRNLEFERLSADVRASKMPVVIIGDLNSTPWSPYFIRLLQQAKMVDSELGFGFQPSWSKRQPLTLLPIDHCLTCGSIHTTRRVVGPDTGSDHLPVYVELSLKPFPKN